MYVSIERGTIFGNLGVILEIMFFLEKEKLLVNNHKLQIFKIWKELVFETRKGILQISFIVRNTQLEDLNHDGFSLTALD